MAAILVSFIGTGSRSGGEYETAKYLFDGETNKRETSVFGSALLQHLKDNGRGIEKWLILGTEKSIWSELIKMFPATLLSPEEEKARDFLEEQAVYCQTDQDYASRISQTHLDNWQKTLTDKLSDTKIICRLVGTGSTLESQQKIVEALLEFIDEGNEIIFDVTHGLRNQPIIVSFALMYLRYLRNIEIENIRFYYGAIDLDGKVVRLDFCNQLFQASEAVATFRQTGNFVKIGQSLGLPANDVEKIAFLDETNNPDKKLAESVKTRLNKTADIDVVRRGLIPDFEKALEWAEDTNLEFRYWRKSRFAFEHKQFLKAIVLLWEAILVAGCKRYRLADLTDFRNRDQAERQLRRELGIISPQKVDVLEKVEYLRNAVAHGTKTVRDDVKEATENQNKFKNIYLEGEELLRFLIGDLR